MKVTLKSVLIRATIFISVSVVLLTLTGCPEEPCCPYVINFYAKPDIVCPKNCFDVQTLLYATVAYHVNRQPCPSIPKPNIDILTKTGKKLNSVNWNKTKKPGVFETSIQILDLDVDSYFILNAFGDNGCPPVTDTTPIIHVVRESDQKPYKFCTSHGDKLTKCKWAISIDNYSKGIVMDSIENPSNNLYTVIIENLGLNSKTSISPGGKANNPYAGTSPNANWTMEITPKNIDPNDCDKFKLEGEDFCINFYVKCICPK